MFIQTLLVVVYIAIQLPLLPDTIRSFQSRIEDAYPADLVISIDNGLLSINREIPFYIDFPELENVNEFKYLVVFDTKATSSDYDTYDSIILVTDAEVVYPQIVSNNTLYEAISIEDLGLPSKITKEKYVSFLSEFDDVILWTADNIVLILISFLIILPVIGSLFLTIWYMIYLLVASALLWSIAQIFQTKKGYWQVYQMGMYGLSVPILFGFILGLLGVVLPYAFMSSFLLWMVIVLARMELKVKS